MTLPEKIADKNTENMITAKEARAYMAKSEKAVLDQMEKIDYGIKKVCIEENFYIYQHTIPNDAFGPPLISALAKHGYKAELINPTTLSISWKE
jgi:hypothetical protein